MVAGEGGDKQTDYAYRTQRHRSDLPDPAGIGREAGERAVRKVAPGSLPSGRLPVVFDPRVGGGIVRGIESMGTVVFWKTRPRPASPRG